MIIKRAEFTPIHEFPWANTYYKSVNDAWENLYYYLNEGGEEVGPRGHKTRETIGCNIYILNPADNLVYNTYRGANPAYAAREYFWYYSGDRSVESAAKLTPFWRKIANDDGTVNSNYGAYIFVTEEDGKSVWEKTVDILRKDPMSRQAIIQVPIMPNRGSKDTPCTSSIQFLVRDNKLFATVYMRSCDISCGFPYDLFNFTMWQINLAKTLGVELGWMRFCAGSLHLYEKHFIENMDEKLDDTFHISKIVQGYSNPSMDNRGDSFVGDLHMLANFKKIGLDKPEGILDTVLHMMYENKRIWNAV